MLRAHIETYGIGPGGRLFRTASGGPIGSSAHWLAWEQARKLGPATRSGGIAARRPSVRPASRSGLALAQRRRTGH